VADELDLLRASLSRGLAFDLSADQGDEAFERHQLLAIRFHRAARLNVPAGIGERNGWCRYFDEHFPRGGEHGALLFDKWRCTLVKDERPGGGIVITHGQPEVHWLQTDRGLCINLETMRDDFVASVDHLIGACNDEERRAATLEAFRNRQWSVQSVTATRPMTRLLMPERLQTFSASASHSVATAIVPDSQLPPSQPG
jgi:hypothetical protein